MADFLFAFHSGFRYMVLLIGVVAAVAAALALRGDGTSGPARSASRLYRVFMMSVDVQVLIGLLVIATREFRPIYVGHFATMVLALAAAHAPAVVMRRRAPERQGTGLLVAGSVVTLALVAGGITALGRPVF